MKALKLIVPVVLGLALVALSVTGDVTHAATTKDVCIAGSTPTGDPIIFIFQGVPRLNAGESITVRGFHQGFTAGSPVHGSAFMLSDGRVLVGLFVHRGVNGNRDLTVSGVTDTNFAGTFTFDAIEDGLGNASEPMQPVDCASIVIP